MGLTNPERFLRFLERNRDWLIKAKAAKQIKSELPIEKFEHPVARLFREKKELVQNAPHMTMADYVNQLQELRVRESNYQDWFPRDFRLSHKPPQFSSDKGYMLALAKTRVGHGKVTQRPTLSIIEKDFKHL